MNIILQGLLLGFAYVMPIGTQNIFVINTALTQSRKRALTTAGIVFFFDVTLSLACFFGIGAFMGLSPWIEFSILGIGSIIVLWIGFSTIKSKATLEDNGDKLDIPITKVIVAACVVTWFNPHAIIDGTMLLGAFHASLEASEYLFFILGVSLASFTWWFALSSFVSIFHGRVNEKALKIINIVCGLIIMFYGVKLFINFIEAFNLMF